MEEWQSARSKAGKLIGRLDTRERILVLAALYWGEGTKRELNLVNGDPELLRVFVECLLSLGVKREDLLFSLRLFEDIESSKARRYWVRVFRVTSDCIRIGERSTGKTKGRFQYGMCRIRVKKSARYFKLIIAVIESLKIQIRPRSSMDRTAAS